MKNYTFEMYQRMHTPVCMDPDVPTPIFIEMKEDVMIAKKGKKYYIYSLPTAMVLDEKKNAKLTANLALYYDRNRKFVCHIARIFSQDIEFELFSQFLDYISERVKRIGVELLRVEVFALAKKEITFPVGGHILSAPISGTIIDKFKKYGFRCENIKYSYSLPFIKKSPCNAVALWQKTKKENKIYWDLWYNTETLESPIQLPLWEKSKKPDFYQWNLDFNTAGFSDNSFVLFLRKKRGFLHWLPNFYPLAKKLGVGTWGFESPKLKECALTMETGKIFRLIVKESKSRRDDIENLIVTACGKIAKFGLTKVEISNVDSKDSDFISVIEKLKGRHIETMELLEKEI